MMSIQSSLEYDVVLIGAGPSNLAVMAALEENFPSVKFLAIECRPAFTWHPGMLFSGTTLQNSFLKDAATQRNPRSKYTFLNFLHHHGRLGQFIDRGSHPVSRIEVTKYMEWIAQELNGKIQYNVRCDSIQVDQDKDDVVHKIALNTGGDGQQVQQILSAKHMVVGIGAAPSLPKGLQSSSLAVHTDEYTSLRPAIMSKHAPRVLILGGGQSAAEVCLDILQHATQPHVTILSRRFLFRSLEANSFINRLFTDTGHLTFYETDPAKRREIVLELKHANYSAVNAGLVDEIYRHCYELSVVGDASPLTLLSYCDVEDIDSANDTVVVQWTDLISNQSVGGDFDFVICATGYDYRKILSLLSPLSTFAEGGVQFERNRDYSLKLNNRFRPKVFVHSLGDGTFGVAEGNMTNHAVRAQEIASSIVRNL